MTNPEISIMIINYNRARYLERTIRSIVEQNIGKEVYEIVLVDNISSDHSLDVMTFMKEFYWDKANIRVFKRIGHKIKEEPGNITKVKNFGIKQCRGEVIMFCDPEVLHGPGTIRKMIENHFQEKDDLYVIGKVYDAEKILQDSIDKTKTFEEALKIVSKNPIIRCGTERTVCFPFLSSVRKKWLVKVRGYEEEFVGGGHDDTDLWNRLHMANVESLFDDSIVGIHQWHESHWINTDYNEKIMSSKQEILIRNNNSWGEIEAVEIT